MASSLGDVSAKHSSWQLLSRVAACLALQQPCAVRPARRHLRGARALRPSRSCANQSAAPVCRFGHGCVNAAPAPVAAVGAASLTRSAFASPAAVSSVCCGVRAGELGAATAPFATGLSPAIAASPPGCHRTDDSAAFAPGSAFVLQPTSSPASDVRSVAAPFSALAELLCSALPTATPSRTQCTSRRAALPLAPSPAATVECSAATCAAPAAAAACALSEGGAAPAASAEADAAACAGAARAEAPTAPDSAPACAPDAAGGAAATAAASAAGAAAVLVLALVEPACKTNARMSAAAIRSQNQRDVCKSCAGVYAATAVHTTCNPFHAFQEQMQQNALFASCRQVCQLLRHADPLAARLQVRYTQATNPTCCVHGAVLPQLRRWQGVAVLAQGAGCTHVHRKGPCAFHCTLQRWPMWPRLPALTAANAVGTHSGRGTCEHLQATQLSHLRRDGFVCGTSSSGSCLRIQRRSTCNCWQTKAAIARRAARTVRSLHQRKRAFQSRACSAALKVWAHRAAVKGGASTARLVAERKTTDCDALQRQDSGRTPARLALHRSARGQHCYCTCTAFANCPRTIVARRNRRRERTTLTLGPDACVCFAICVHTASTQIHLVHVTYQTADVWAENCFHAVSRGRVLLRLRSVSRPVGALPFRAVAWPHRKWHTALQAPQPHACGQRYAYQSTRADLAIIEALTLQPSDAMCAQVAQSLRTLRSATTDRKHIGASESVNFHQRAFATWPLVGASRSVTSPIRCSQLREPHASIAVQIAASRPRRMG